MGASWFRLGLTNGKVETGSSSMRKENQQDATI